MSAVFQGASTKDFRIPFPIRLLQDAPGRNETPETPCYCPGLKFPCTAPPKARRTRTWNHARKVKSKLFQRFDFRNIQPWFKLPWRSCNLRQFEAWINNKDSKLLFRNSKPLGSSTVDFGYVTCWFMNRRLHQITRVSDSILLSNQSTKTNQHEPTARLCDCY